MSADAYRCILFRDPVRNATWTARPGIKNGQAGDVWTIEDGDRSFVFEGSYERLVRWADLMGYSDAEPVA